MLDSINLRLHFKTVTDAGADIIVLLKVFENSFDRLFAGRQGHLGQRLVVFVDKAGFELSNELQVDFEHGKVTHEVDQSIILGPISFH